MLDFFWPILQIHPCFWTNLEKKNKLRLIGFEVLVEIDII